MSSEKSAKEEWLEEDLEDADPWLARKFLRAATLSLVAVIGKPLQESLELDQI